jgi:hypothetical protein
MNWSGLFQFTITKSIAALACRVAVLFIVLGATGDIECAVPKAPPRTYFPSQPTFDLTIGPDTTSDGCKTYGTFLGMPANTAPFILGFFAGVAGWVGEALYKHNKGG